MNRQYIVFSKHLSWLDRSQLAEAVAEAGFDGVDLAVRPGGHVLPEQVEEELPRFVEVLAARGLSCPSIVTSITGVTPEAETIIRVAASCGVSAYRMGYLKYGDQVEASLIRHRAAFEDLAAVNARYGVHGAYQNHAGTWVGSAVWDLLPLLEGLDPDAIGLQYDVRHAVLESGSSWEIALRRLATWVRTIVVKDGYWRRTDDGTFKATSCPIGTGMVDWARFNELLPDTGWDGITSVHFEFPLFSEDPASLSAAERTKKTVEAMRKELDRVKQIV
ncbi:MAG: sugar phosphate isomerase/epimerase family protein [Spirochaetaceae bacterium]